ncbi:hypothetical protein ACJ72_03120, partial [Emergomyces africanus]
LAIYQHVLVYHCSAILVMRELVNHKHRGDIMPGIYRAPEVILGMEWDCKVDLWSVGVMVRT